MKNNKTNALYSSSLDKVKERVQRFHQRLLKQYQQRHIMIITHAGWLSIQFNGKQFQNGQIHKEIYEDDFVNKYQIYFLLFIQFFENKIFSLERFLLLNDHSYLFNNRIKSCSNTI